MTRILSTYFFPSLPHGQFEYCTDTTKVTWRTDWVSSRSITFSKYWGSHKSRNIAVYACIGTRHLAVVNELLRNVLRCPDVFYDERYGELFEVPKKCFSRWCLKRLGRAHFIYAEYILKTFDVVVATTIKPAKPTRDGRIAVLLEPRKHPLLEYTVKQVMNTLGPEWALQIFVSSGNEHFVRERLRVREGDTGQHILLTKLENFGLDRMSEYGNRLQSAFSAHEGLYHAIKSEHILWFQTDVIMRHPPQDDWLSHAYIGAEWRHCEYPTCSELACHAVCAGGNSGLSIRRKSMMLKVATRGALPQYIWGEELGPFRGSNRNYTDFTSPNAHFASDEFHDNLQTRWFEDDIQLSYKLERLGLLPPGELLSKFSISQALPIQGLCEANPSGMHKPWEAPWISPIIVAQLLASPHEHAHRLS